MTTLIIINDHQFGTVTNELKVGTATHSCDPSLRHLGEVTLKPGEKRSLQLNDEVNDVYFKNIYEFYWTHQAIFASDDQVTIRASHSSYIPEEPRDVCNDESNVFYSSIGLYSLASLPRIGEIRGYQATPMLDCVSERHTRETERRGPYLHTAPSGWMLREAKFMEHHRRYDAGVDPWRKMSRGTNIATSSKIIEAYEYALDFLLRQIEEAGTTGEEGTGERAKNEITGKLTEKRDTNLELASTANSSHDSVEFYLYAKGRGIIYRSRSRIQGYLWVEEQYVGTDDDLLLQIYQRFAEEELKQYFD
jgi:hypothetical protein